MNLDIEAELELIASTTAEPWFIDDASDAETTAVSSADRIAVCLAQHGEDDRPRFDPQSHTDLTFICHARTNYPLALQTMLAIKELCESETSRYGGHAHEAGRASMARDVQDILEGRK